MTSSISFDVGHESTVLCLASSGDTGSLCASGDENGFVILWDQSRKPAGKIALGEQEATAVCFGETEPHLFAASGKSIRRFDLRAMTTAVESFNVNTEDINELHVKQKYLAACDDSGQIKLINLVDKRVRTLKKHENICSTMNFRTNFPSEILSGGLDSKIIRWDVYKSKAMKLYDMKSLEDTDDRASFLVSPPMVHCLRCSPRSVVAAGLENGTVQVFDGSAKPLVNKGAFLGHSKGVSQVHFLADNLLVSGGNDGLLVVHNFEVTNEHRWRDNAKVIDHGSAVNWLTSWSKWSNQIIVADQRHFIGVHQLERS